MSRQSVSAPYTTRHRQRKHMIPLSVAVILSASTSWSTLLPDPQFAAPIPNAFGLPSPNNTLAASTLVDLDGDGDLDFVAEINSYGSAFLLENTGSPVVPAFAAPTVLFTVPGLYAIPTFGDIDGDGDFDAIVGTYSSGLYFFENTGNSTAPAFAFPSVNPFGLFPFPFQQRLAPDFADLDGDGDLDIISGMSYYGVTFFRNTGNSTSPAFFISQVPGSFGISPYSQLTTVKVSDINNDGDLDAFLGAIGILTVSFQRNIGNSSVPSFGTPQLAPFGMPPGGFHRAPTLGDLDDDGDIDMITVSFSGGNKFTYWQNTAPMDTTPPVPTIIVDGDSTTPNDTVSYYVQFNELVGNTFTSADITPLAGSLSANSINVAPSPSDPGYGVYVTFQDPDAAGTFAFKITTAVADIYGNSMSIAVDSPTITITPPGDVNFSGTFDLADVALLADANLGLATLP